MLFDQKEIWRNAQAGDMAFDNTAPVLLTIASKSGSTPNGQREPLGCAICEGPQEAMKWFWKTTEGKHGFAMFELVSVAHALANRLAHTAPHSRGQGA